MKIVDYNLYPVPPRWLFLRIETDSGVVGWGEPVVEGRVRTVKSAVSELLDTYLVGEDPLKIEDHWQMLYRGGFYRGGPILMSAIAGIDQALWDIAGKHHGVPVYDLLGGPVRDRIRVYGWIGGDSPEDVAREAEEAVRNGLTAVKMNSTGKLRRLDTPEMVTNAGDHLQAVREAVGQSVDVGIDFHGRGSKGMAKRLARELEPHDPLFIEEPVRPGNEEALEAIAASTSIPIAIGERLYSRWEFKPVLTAGAVDVVQPDLSHAGGISEVRRIAAMAEAHDVSLAPHCPLGPIALAACLQVDATAHNALIQEQSLGIQYTDTAEPLDYVANHHVLDFEDGYISVPDAPGLGIKPDLAVIRERARDLDSDRDEAWHNPIWRHEDGSLAEW